MRARMCFLLAGALMGQEPNLEADLQALLSTPITITSSRGSTIREAAGIVSAITREEIQASGATDLVDVLRLVPGIEFGCDVQGLGGLSMRGLWGYEGKVLLKFDDIEMNDMSIGLVHLLNHFPVDQSASIEPGYCS